MTARLGLGVGHTEVRAMLVRDGEVAWRAARPVEAEQQLCDVIVQVLSGAPLGRFLQPPVVAALGPSVSQVKRLQGLPGIHQQAVVSQVVRANVSRYFLRNGVPLSATSAHRDADSWWGAVLEDPSVEAVELACERLGLRLEGCIPTAAALAPLFRDGCVEWLDGQARATVTVRGGTWVDIQRGAIGAAPAEPGPALARLGPDAVRYADAFGAANSNRRSPLFLRSSRRHGGLRRQAPLRAALFALVLAAAAGALAAPGVAAARQLARDQHRLAALQPALAEWAPVAYQLRQHTGGLEEIGRFARGRRSSVLLLGAISNALPESTAIVSLRVDSAAGSVTLLSTKAAPIISRLATVEALAEPRIVGAVTRENVGGVQVQRIAVRFRLAPVRPDSVRSRP